MNAPSRASGYLRAVLFTLGGVVAVLAALVAALLIWRVELANAYGPRLVEGELGVPVQFTVERISAEELTIAGIRVADGPHVAHFRTSFTLDGLRAGRIGDVAVEGLSGTIGVSEAGDFRIAGLPEEWFAPSAEDVEGRGPAFPLRPARITLTDIDIAAETPAGPSRITGKVAAAFPRDGADFIPDTLELDLRDDESDTTLTGTLALVGGQAEDDRAKADFRARVPLARWGAFLPGIRAAEGTLALDGTLEADPAGLEASGLAAPVPGGPTERLRQWIARDLVSGTLDIVWSGLTLTGMDGGRTEISDNTLRYRIKDRAVEVTAEAPLESSISGMADRLAPFVSEIPPPYRAMLDAILAEDTMRSRLAFEADTPAIFRVADMGWRIEALPALSISAGPAVLSLRPGDIDLGDRLLNHRIDGLEVTLDLDAMPLKGGAATGGTATSESATSGSVTGRLSLTAGELTAQVLQRGASVDFAGNLDFRGLALSELGLSGFEPLSGDFELSGRMDAGPDRVVIYTSPGGRFALAEQRLTDTLALNAPVNIGIDTAFGDDTDAAAPLLSFDPSAVADTVSLDLPLALSASDLQIGARRVTTTPFHARVRRDDGTLSAHLDGLALTLPGDRTTIEGIVLDAAWDGATGDTVLAFDSLSRRGDVLLDRRSVLDGRVSFPQGFALDYAGKLSVADGALEGAVRYTIPADPGTAARFTFDGEPIRYSPDGLQPGRLSPLFADVFKDVGGALEIDVDARLSDAGSGRTMAGFATLRLEDFGFAAGPAQLREAAGTITFDLSKPPATEPDQALSALMIVPGLGRLPVEARFSLTEDTRLLIPVLSLDSLGGALTLTNAEVDPLSDRMTGELGIAGLSIHELTTLANIDGVSGTGTLVGTIPVIVTTAGIQVDSGLIEAEGSGLLSIDNPTVNSALTGQHQSVQLLLDALKDFHYEDLALTLDLPKDGNGTLGLRLAGSNPDTLEGHPFDININIESDFSKMFAVLQQGFAVTDRMLDRFRDQIVD